MKLTTAVLGFGLVVLSACAQQPDAKAYQEQEKRWQSCPDGYYSGPRPGRLNYGNDKYLWVVTPEFAKRFCMPEHLVDPDLKGAEAIAFKRVPSEDGFDRCAVQDGKTHCVDDGVGRFEVYLKSDLNLPAAHPEVRFFDDERNHSYWHITTSEPPSEMPSQRYRKGLYQLPPGAINRFGNPYHHPDAGYQFSLIGIQRNGMGASVSALWEVGFRAEWTMGIDLVTLESRGIAGDLDLTPRQIELGVNRFAIVLHREPSPKHHDEMYVAKDYSHVIHLPKRFMDRVKAAVDQAGTWNDVIRTFRQP
ncbi:MAG: hypothetical protein PHD37_18525 [Gallionellaceae bacterium]|nr:hypothetical protein [Gallionellaceae bacterium]